MAVAILASVVLTALAIPCVATLQGNGYKATGVLGLVNTVYFCSVCTLQAICVGLAFVNYPYLWVFVLIVIGTVALYYLLETQTLKCTARAIRLLATIFAINWLISWLCPCTFTLSPFVSVVALFVNYPIEQAICQYYLSKARKKIAKVKAVKIAVTGSFGKTSVKQILCQLLPNALATPFSYNTPMGLAKFINQTDFSGADYVIFEMGARKKGDIAKLCRLVCPTVGVLTGITAQHINSFKTLDAVIETKCELINYLGKDDLCVINGFDEIASTCLDVGVCKKILCPNPWQQFKVQSLSLDGTTFALFDGQSTYQFTSPLFGVGHFHNVALCVAVALALGQEVSSLQGKVALLKPVKHRLEVIRQSGVTIIDDAYNANLTGVRLACSSIAQVQGFKVAISQGIVECGKDSNTINTQVGQMLAGTFDVVIACGANAKPILSAVGDGKGLYAKDVTHAVSLAKQFFDGNAICLFQNDIPKLF